MTPTTRIGDFSSAIARIAHATAAPPPCRPQRDISAAGLGWKAALVERDALPTRPRTGDWRRISRLVTNGDQPRGLRTAAGRRRGASHPEVSIAARSRTSRHPATASDVRLTALQTLRCERVRRSLPRARAMLQ